MDDLIPLIRETQYMISDICEDLFYLNPEFKKYDDEIIFRKIKRIIINVNPYFKHVSLFNFLLKDTIKDILN